MTPSETVLADSRRSWLGLMDQSVRVVPFEEAEDGLPCYEPEHDLVVFPSETSVCWSDLPEGELAAARRIILIDSR